MEISRLDLTKKQIDLYETIKQNEDGSCDSWVAREYCSKIEAAMTILSDLDAIDGIASDCAVLTLRSSLHNKLRDIDYFTKDVLQKFEGLVMKIVPCKWNNHPSNCQ